MSSGRQKAKENIDAFQSWVSTQTNDDFKQIVHRGRLKRGEIAAACGFGKSALVQNPALREALESLENRLRDEGVLPPKDKASDASSDKPKEYDTQAVKQAHSSQRVSTLEVENIELKAKIKELESKLERFGELSETLSDMGFMPR